MSLPEGLTGPQQGCPSSQDAKAGFTPRRRTHAPVSVALTVKSL
jgi:hypothetical protein